MLSSGNPIWRNDRKTFHFEKLQQLFFSVPKHTQCCQKKRLMQHSGKHALVLTEYAHIHLYVSVCVCIWVYITLCMLFLIHNFLLIRSIYFFWHFLVKMKKSFQNKNNNKPLWWSRKADIQIERSRQCETLQYWNLYCFHRFSCFLIAKDCYPKEKQPDPHWTSALWDTQSGKVHVYWYRPTTHVTVVTK